MPPETHGRHWQQPNIQPVPLPITEVVEDRPDSAPASIRQVFAEGLAGEPDPEVIAALSPDPWYKTDQPPIVGADEARPVAYEGHHRAPDAPEEPREPVDRDAALLDLELGPAQPSREVAAEEPVGAADLLAPAANPEVDLEFGKQLPRAASLPDHVLAELDRFEQQLANPVRPDGPVTRLPGDTEVIEPPKPASEPEAAAPEPEVTTEALTVRRQATAAQVARMIALHTEAATAAAAAKEVQAARQAGPHHHAKADDVAIASQTADQTEPPRHARTEDKPEVEAAHRLPWQVAELMRERVKPADQPPVPTEPEQLALKPGLSPAIIKRLQTRALTSAVTGGGELVLVPKIPADPRLTTSSGRQRGRDGKPQILPQWGPVEPGEIQPTGRSGELVFEVSNAAQAAPEAALAQSGQAPEVDQPEIEWPTAEQLPEAPVEDDTMVEPAPTPAAAAPVEKPAASAEPTVFFRATGKFGPQ